MVGLRVEQIAVKGFDENFSYLIVDDAGRSALLVDPCGEFERVASVIAATELSVQGILLTHSHHDHLDRLDDALAQYPVPVYVHESAVIDVPDEGVRHLQDEMVLALGEYQIGVLHTPGHIHDAVCFFIPAEGARDGVPQLITGDTLFVEGCGRTSTAHVEELYQSLLRLSDLPDETVVYPGHDYGSQPTSTIGREKTVNRFLQASDFETFKRERLG